MWNFPNSEKQNFSGLQFCKIALSSIFSKFIIFHLRWSPAFWQSALFWSGIITRNTSRRTIWQLCCWVLLNAWNFSSIEHKKSFSWRFWQAKIIGWYCPIGDFNSSFFSLTIDEFFGANTRLNYWLNPRPNWFFRKIIAPLFISITLNFRAPSLFIRFLLNSWESM